MRSMWVVITAILSLALRINAFGDGQQEHWVKYFARVNNVSLDAKVPTGYFDQWVNHKDHSKGTFKQRYFYFDEYYKGPGSPIILMTPGESSLEGSQYFFEKGTIHRQLAESIGGAFVAIEHRYWGKSRPFQKYNSETLQLLTLDQALQDFTNFAENVRLPFDKKGTSRASKAPWVFSSGSYGGAVVAWTQQLYPGVFWAYHASSAVVEAIDSFWQYFDVMAHKSIAEPCRSGLKLATGYINRVLETGTADEVHELKSWFGLQHLKFNGDFAWGVIGPLYSWQFGPDEELCYYINSANKTADPGRAEAKQWGGYVTPDKFCRGGSCYDTHDKHPADNISDGDWLWAWMLCNEPFGWWRVHEAPGRGVGVVPHALNAAYSQRQCSYLFPTHNGYTYGSNRGRTVQDTNSKTAGWNRTPAKRIVWQNAGYDPWIGATISSPYRPGGPQNSTNDEPIFFDPTGYHVADFGPYRCTSPYLADICGIIESEVKVLTHWVNEFKPADATDDS